MKSTHTLIIIILMTCSILYVTPAAGFGISSLKKAVSEKTTETKTEEAAEPAETKESAESCECACDSPGEKGEAKTPATTAQDTTGILPFGVTIGGQKAEPKKGATYAVIPKPVPANAALVVDAEPGMVIINAFPADKDGTVASGAQPKIIIIQKGTETTLDSTMDKKALAPGTYLMNVVISSKGTSRVLLTIE